MRPADFFVVRSPLLEGDGSQTSPELARDPIVREALERASPSLLDALDGKRPSRGDVWPPITRYIQRMRGRSTPFSLLSGYACGTTGGPRTGIRFVHRADYQRVARLDVDAVGRVIAAHARAHEAETLWVAARGVARFPDIVRVISRLEGGDQVRLVDVARSNALDCLLAAASKPSSFASLADALASFTEQRAQAEDFVRTVIEERLIVPANAPPVLLLDELAPLQELSGGAAQLAHEARRVRATRLGDRRPPELSGQVEGLEARDRIFDLVKPTEIAALGDDVLAALKEVLAALPRLTPAVHVDPRLEDFARRFSSLFEGREVPLLSVVDPRRGFGFPPWADAPLQRSSHEDLEAWVVTQFERSCRNRTHVDLRASDLLETVRWTYPESFACTFSLAQEPLQLWDIGISRAPGTALFARAAAVLPDGFHERARAFLAEVARREPDVDFADLAYFVPGKSAAFTQYPQLQPCEITLTPTAGEHAHSLDPNDLLVSVMAGAVHLRSTSSGRAVRVRTTSAANADRQDTTDLYRFLSAVAHQDDRAGGGWSWGALRAAERLPRVTYGGHVLSPARWNLGPARSQPLRKAKTAQERWDLVQRLRAELELPRHLLFHERHDHFLPVDLDDSFSVEAWLDIVQEKIALLEAFPVGRSAVEGPEGPFHHQIVLPMLGDPAKPSPTARAPKPHVPAEPSDRVIPGGSPLFLSFWGDADELLAILADLVASVVHPREADGTITHWFFLPYSNPDPHVRLRLFGDPAHLWAAPTMAAIADVLDPLAAQGVIRNVSFETYDRETYRYGGPRGMDLAEHLFHLSSAMALDLHQETLFDVESEKELEEIIVPLVASQRALLSATGLPLEAQRALAEKASERYPRHADPAIPRKQGSALYRNVRDALAERVRSGDVGRAQNERLAAILSEARGVEMHRSFEEWFVDCLHVHSIRLLTTWHPVSHLETTAYHVLQKVIGGEIARSADGRRE